MTRFARAKGSKASNERIPEEATSWTIMKQQLLERNKDIEENKNRMEAIDKRNANYKAFLQEKEETESKRSEWANFPGVDNKNMKSKNCTNNRNGMSSDEDDESFQILKMKVDKVLNANESKVESDSDGPPEEESAKKEIAMPIISVKKAKKRKIKIDGLNEVGNLKNDHEKTLNTSDIINEKGGPQDKQKKRKKLEESGTLQKKSKLDISTEERNTEKKNNKKKSNKAKQKKSGLIEKKAIKENPTPLDLKKIEKKKQKRIKQLEKKKKSKAEQKQQKELEELSNTNDIKGETGESNFIKDTSDIKKKSPKKLANSHVKNSNGIEKKKFKNKDKEEHLRKKPLLPHKMFINGQELEIDYVDGFPVKKEDALRLKQLRREMISKGLPRSEINQSLKLERRKAEKAFAREKKKVCFNCRMSGHNLSECPELEKNQVVQTAGSGICFKCGSTEHTHFECKVVRGQEFKFAQCFICKEQGHIARQCPDNARGLYPKGGACNVCGDVTHLKRDCPKYQAQQQHMENNLRIETVGFSNPDILETKNENTQFSINKKQNKVIKF